MLFVDERITTKLKIMMGWCWSCICVQFFPFKIQRNFNFAGQNKQMESGVCLPFISYILLYLLTSVISLWLSVWYVCVTLLLKVFSIQTFVVCLIFVCGSYKKTEFAVLTRRSAAVELWPSWERYIPTISDSGYPVIVSDSAVLENLPWK